MPENRFFADTPLKPATQVTLSAQEHHHLAHVMRQKVDDVVELVNGKGILSLAKVLSTTKKGTVLEVLSVEKEQSSSSHPVILIQGIPRPSRLDTILEKGTELGMDEIWLFPGERSEKTLLNEHQKSHLEGVLISAMKQCGRLYCPKISFLPPIKKWTTKLTGYFGTLDSTAPLFQSLLEKNSNTTTCFAIGPEAGFTPQERAILSSLGLQGVLLNPHILRTDTAALCALSLLIHYRMDT